jgi:transcription antitermination factor NusG
MGEARPVLTMLYQDSVTVAPARSVGVHCWYALKVRSGAEASAAQALSVRGFDPYYPMRREARKYSDRVKMVETAIFPGYLFCNFALANKLPVISSSKIDYIVSLDGAPAAIPEEEIEYLRRVVEVGATATPYLRAGQEVRVISGPLTGVSGILSADGVTSQLVVSVHLLGRSVAVQIDRHEIEVV